MKDTMIGEVKRIVFIQMTKVNLTTKFKPIVFLKNKS